MNPKQTYILTFVSAVLCLFNAEGQPQISSPDKLFIELPDQKAVDRADIRLADIATLKGSDDIIRKAGQLCLGLLVVKGQVVGIDRNTVLSRLGTLSIPASRIEFSGSEIVQVRRNQAVVDAGKIADAARAFLDKQLAGRQISSLSLLRSPQEVYLNDPNMAVQLNVQLNRYQVPGTQKLTVTVSQNGLPVGKSEVVFTLQYKVKQAVALCEIQAGQTIDSQNVQIRDIEASSPQPADWKEPFGLVATRKITQGALVNANWLEPVSGPVLIKRNQQVLVQIDTGAIYISAPGQALDEGKSGDLIRVRRGQRPDERIIYCIVQKDGSVQPQI